MFENNWLSLSRYSLPQWMKDAKFGIYASWGVYSVPACGPNGVWYGSNMYVEGHPQNLYHCEHYGSPAEYPYHRFIPQFKAENFNAMEWADLFERAGAKFAGLVAELHDGFSMWDSQVNPWNAVQMGPHRDVTGELEEAVRKKGLKFLTTFHHAENWNFYPHWIKECAHLRDKRYAGLYGKAHNLEWRNDRGRYNPWGEWTAQDKPDREFEKVWLTKIKEVLDRYSPDVIWFDFGLDMISDTYKTEMLSYYYNSALEKGQEPVVIYKNHDLPPSIGLVDIEQGSFNHLPYHSWITDTTTDSGSGWGYVRDIGFKTSERLIHYLIDNVSKNGYLLLNIGPRSDGTIPDEVKKQLMDIGDWLEINGEAIYGTVPWVCWGEGPTEIPKEGTMGEVEGQAVAYTCKDIRFTCASNCLYAIFLGWPENGEVVIHTLSRLRHDEIRRIVLIGFGYIEDYRMETDGLHVKLPDQKPCEHAFVLKIYEQEDVI